MPDAKFPTEEDPTLDARALSTRTRAMNPSSHDELLQARIWEQIRATRELDAKDLSVVVRNRSATLFGAVADEGQRARMQSIAAGISGVVEVTNRLKVGAPAR